MIRITIRRLVAARAVISRTVMIALQRFKQMKNENQKGKKRHANLIIRPAILDRISFPSIAAAVIAAGIRAVERFAAAGVGVAHFEGLTF